MEGKGKSEKEKKFDNEIKKIKMELESGATFFTPEGSDIPADIEAQFLDNVMAFEKAAKNSVTKTVGEVLNHPKLPPAKDLTDPQLHETLENFYELMEENNMAMDVIYETPEREVYNFIATEFLDHEIEMMGFMGMTTHFIYEEFVPNDREDLRKAFKEILPHLFEQDFEFFDYYLAQKVKYNGVEMEPEAYVKILQAMHENRSLELLNLEVTHIAIAEDNISASVTGNIKYTSKFTSEKERLLEDEARINFVKRYELWGANQISIPGLGL